MSSSSRGHYLWELCDTWGEDVYFQRIFQLVSWPSCFRLGMAFSGNFSALEFLGNTDSDNSIQNIHEDRLVFPGGRSFSYLEPKSFKQAFFFSPLSSFFLLLRVQLYPCTEMLVLLLHVAQLPSLHQPQLKPKPLVFKTNT